MLGSIITGGMGLLGGFLNRNSAEKQAEANMAFAREQFEFQKSMAQNAVSWKVDDAKRAGIHPLYALGAPTISPSAVSVGDSGNTSHVGDAVSSMGQDIGRAVQATQTEKEREDGYAKTVKALTVQKLGLENDILASKAAVARSAANPPAQPFDPANVPTDKVEGRPPLAVGGNEWKTYPGATNAEDFEKRYGDLFEELAGAGNMVQDVWWNLTQSQKWQALMAMRRRMQGNLGDRVRSELDMRSLQGRKRSRMGPN